MRPFLILLSIAILFNVWHADAAAVDSQLTVLENRATEIEQVLTVLLKEKRTLEAHSGTLAEEIAKLKAKSDEGLSIYNRYRLDGKLKKSQVLADKLQQCESELATARREYRELAVSLDKLYSEQINVLLAQLEKSLTHDAAGRLAALYIKRNSWREKVPERSSSALILFEVRLDSLDGPREIREKADLVRDMEEEVDLKRELLVKKVAGLKEEKKIREKMGDFLQEVTLFGDRERGRRNDQILTENIPAIADIALEGADRFSKLDALPSSQTVTRDQVFRFWETVETLDPANLSSQNIDHVIEQYVKIIGQLSARAQKLREQSQLFDKKAEAFNQ